MYGIINVIKSYNNTTTKTWWGENYTASLFETKAEAKAMLDKIDGGPVMYLGHNEYSNRYYIRRLTPTQAQRLQTRGY